MAMSPDEDPIYQAGYQQGLADGAIRRAGPSNERRYLFAAGTLVAGIGGAVVTGMLFSTKYRDIGGVLAFSAAVLGAAFGAASILVDEAPVTPNLGIKV